MAMPAANRSVHAVNSQAFRFFNGGDESYRTCCVCGADCPPEPMLTAIGLRLAFCCLIHGPETIIDPFASGR